MIPIAERGQYLLLQIDLNMGRILDTEEKLLYPTQELESIWARGYWEETDISDKELLAVLEVAKEVK